MWKKNTNVSDAEVKKLLDGENNLTPKRLLGNNVGNVKIVDLNSMKAKSI